MIQQDSMHLITREVRSKAHVFAYTKQLSTPNICDTVYENSLIDSRLQYEGHVRTLCMCNVVNITVCKKIFTRTLLKDSVFVEMLTTGKTYVRE